MNGMQRSAWCAVVEEGYQQNRIFATHLAGVLVGFAVVWQHARLEAPRQQRGKTQIPDLDLTRVAVDVYLVAAQVTMDDGRRLAVQVAEAQQYLQQ